MKKEICEIIAELYPEYDITASDEVKEDFWTELSEKQKYDVNCQYLIEIGTPEYDYIVCWEPGRLDTAEVLTDYDNFYEFDLLWWEYQKKASYEALLESHEWAKETPEKYASDYIETSTANFDKNYNMGYTVSMAGDWFRLIDNGTFIYSSFISAKWHLFYLAEEHIDELQEKHIPYTFRDTDIDTCFNTEDPKERYDAAGREVELESYQTVMRSYTYTQMADDIDTLLLQYHDELTGTTFRYDVGYTDDEDFDPFTNFVFFDVESLKRVKTKQFLKTFKDAAGDYTVFDRLIAELLKIVSARFDTIYTENKKLFD